MGSVLARLEQRLGRFAIDQLPLLIVGGTAAAFILGSLKPVFLDALVLDPEAVRHGQVWRLFTYLFLPRTSHPLLLFFDLYLTWLVGSSLEGAWGSFKLNAYYLVGMIGTTIAAWLTGAAEGNTYLNHSLFLAFATVFPDYEILIFFVLPVRMKWLGLFTGAVMAWSLVEGESPGARGAIIAAFATYILFLGTHLLAMLRDRRMQLHAQARREAMRSVPPPAPDAQAMGSRTCAICGASEQDGADIRVCSCESCGGKPRSLCLHHARNH